MNIQIGSFISVFVLCACVIQQTDGRCQWSKWSSCSRTCEEGIRSRKRLNCIREEVQTKPCFIMHCPSYLSWPRLHFSGFLVADVNTINNIRCAYENKHFTPTMQSRAYIGYKTPSGNLPYYKKVSGNWNPDGSNHIYFRDTKITSICLAPGKCSLNSSIVNATLMESTRGVMAVLDTDWQQATEIWGLKLIIPGVLSASYKATSVQAEKLRCKLTNKMKGYSYCSMGVYKSKLIDVVWTNNYYKGLFKHAKELSISFVYDIYDQISLEGRITGSIGLTSAHDPDQITATRALFISGWTDVGSAPFFIHEKRKFATFDLGYSVPSPMSGKFSGTKLGCLDIAVLLSKSVYCRHFYNPKICVFSPNLKSIIKHFLTKSCAISNMIGEDNQWYEVRGGVIDVSLKHLTHNELKLIHRNRIVLVKNNKTTVLSETPKGVRIGLMGPTVHRLNVGEKTKLVAFVSSYGRPQKKWKISLESSTTMKVSDCGRPSCNMSMGLPKSALGFNQRPGYTDFCGQAELEVAALHDPNSPRGCGLDGQVYPTALIVRNHHNQVYTEGAYLPTNIVARKLTQTETIDVAIKIYDDHQVLECPSWENIKEIFIQYSNLYTVMSKNDIIHLHLYGNVKRRSKMLVAAMFQTPFNDSRYMPNSRDLSKSKLTLIENWIKCGMKKEVDVKQNDNDQCNVNIMETRLKELQFLLQSAVGLELATIPPYMTAWLSLKTEFGRNIEVANVIKSVFVEEMLHLSLAANILNAIGGSVNLTSIPLLPSYPTSLPSGSFYNLAPSLQVSIEPASIGVIRDVFAKIEKPISSEKQKIIQKIVDIWLLLNGKETSKKLDLQRKYPTLNLSEIPSNEVGVWKTLKSFASYHIREMTHKTSPNIGSYYIDIALRMIWLESCAKNLNYTFKIPSKTYSTNSIFLNDSSKQLTMDQWYNPTEDDETEEAVEVLDEEINNTKTEDNSLRHPLFPVTDLSSALRAVIEIIYQGEGGSSVTPFVTSYFGQTPNKEISHYYRFLEIVYGRKLKEVNATIEQMECINHHQSDLKTNYCYIGEELPFYEDGVWPIISNPNAHMYAKGSAAYKFNRRFNIEYTRLLTCLQNTFGGYPDNMKSCMRVMYNMVMAGKKLVRTAIGPREDTKDIKFGNTGKNAAPTWEFIRELSERAGLTIKN